MVGVIAGALPGWASGYGYGSGYGDGSGDGSGYGSGYGDGSGDGSGDGYGYGYGSGDGYGDGYGYWRAAIETYATAWSSANRDRLAAAIKAGATIAYWRSDKNGRACHGGRNDPVQPGTVETAPGPLKLCHRGTLHATRNPHQWSGDRLWVVALYGEIAEQPDKIGSLKREIIGEVKVS